MTLIKWRPVTELERMRTDLDKVFGDFFEPASRGALRRRNLESRVVVPEVDIYEMNGEIVVKADIPGVEKENIDLTITKDSLTIKGEVKKEDEVKEENYYSLERSYGNFTRTIPLTGDVDSDKAKATYKNGVLEITLPKKEEAKPKQLKVNVN